MARLKIYKDKLGKYRFFFKPNNKVTLISVPYTSMLLCLQKIHFFKTHSHDDSFYIRQIANCGSPFFTFQKNFNGEVFGTSESFLCIKTMEEAILLIRSSAKLTSIDDEVYIV